MTVAPHPSGLHPHALDALESEALLREVLSRVRAALEVDVVTVLRLDPPSRHLVTVLTEARTRGHESVDCPECGSPTTPLAIVSWGNCRACRTAQSRLTQPLRW